MILIAEKMTVALAVAVGGSCGDECHTATANCGPMVCLAQPLGTDLHRHRQSFIMGWVTGVGLSSLLKDEGRNFVKRKTRENKRV